MNVLPSLSSNGSQKLLREMCRVFSRDDVTKRANYIGTRNGPHGAYSCLSVTSKRNVSGNVFNESQSRFLDRVRHFLGIAALRRNLLLFSLQSFLRDN